MAKFLIFRTDRIGDFITSQVVTNSISEVSKKNQVDVVASRYNSKYIKNFKFINSSIKICFLKDFYPKFLISFFYTKYLKNTETNTQYKNFQILLNYLDIKSPKYINYYKNYNFTKNKFKLNKPYVHLHLDEKWFKDYYFHDFDYMNLKPDSIYFFLKSLINKFKFNIIITQGFKKVKIMNEFKIKYFKNIKLLNKVLLEILKT